MKWLLVSVEWRHLEDNFALDPAARSSEDLLSECLDSRNETAWTEFMRRFHPLIASVVVRISRHWDECTPQAIDDLIQEVYLKLCASGLRSFALAQVHSLVASVRRDRTPRWRVLLLRFPFRAPFQPDRDKRHPT